jgi:DNA polymerase-3 subunit delta'
VIIDQADALVVHAQNALLKSLEEPPSGTVFLLVTSTPDTLLATVRSRCPRLQFRPLDTADLARALVEKGRSEPEARAIAATANGSLGVALAAEGTDVVDARDVAMRVLSQAAVSDEPRRRIDLARELLVKPGSGAGARTEREQLAVHLRAMSSILRDVELISMQQDALAPLANADVRPALERLTPFHGQRGVDAFEAVDRSLLALDRNAGVKLVADWLVLHL